ncbi:MAG: 30S ribosomal protein S1 [Rhodobiaceae bacterium]|nr:30S ribosomal protein S1 [Rhodobiaceae bacterium]
MSNLTEKSPEISSERFSELLEESLSNSFIQEGKVILGTIVSIESDLVIIDFGMKTEGRVSIDEFKSEIRDSSLKIGDQVEVYLERIENALGDAVLSRDKAKKEENWFKLQECQKENVVVQGEITGKVRGGFTVDIDGTQAFLPGSQVDVKPIRDIRPLMYMSQSFHILKMDKRRGNIVVSRKSVLTDSSNVSKSEVLESLSEGQEIEGIVKNITDYGAFIDLGGIDGLLHVTDISWKRINNPAEIISIGEKVKVLITKLSREDQRVSLGMKQLQDDPWVDVNKKYEVGKKYNGQVTNMADYGAFVELEGGLEGLVHVSEMSWVSKIEKPSKYVNIGDEVQVMVLEIDSEKKRLSLGIKQCFDNPWENFAQKNPVGNLVKGQIQNIADFGIFVQVDEGLDGLVHLSDIDWKVEGNIAIKEYKVGQEIEAKILDFDIEKERISLGIKQLSDDPLSSLDRTKKGDVLTCTVSNALKSGIEVNIGTDFPAFIKRSDLSMDKSEQNPERFEIGQKVDAKVIRFDKKSRKINLSIKALQISDEKEAIEQYGSKDSGASLGDILGEALDKSDSLVDDSESKDSEDLND